MQKYRRRQTKLLTNAPPRDDFFAAASDFAADADFALVNPDFVALEGGAAAGSGDQTGVEAETPGMQGACQGAIADPAAFERRAGVRAVALNGEEAFFSVENEHTFAVMQERPAAAGRKFIDPGDGSWGCHFGGAQGILVSMTVAEILKELKSLGTEQTRKTFARHGLTENFYGVRWGDIDKMAKRLKKQPELACELWKTGIFDARILAIKIADVDSLTKTTLNQWCKDIGRITTMDFANMVSRGKHAVSLAESWTKGDAKRNEAKHCVGWTLVGAIASSRDEIEAEWFADFLTRIENEIADAPNWVRYSMNGALIAIGGRDDAKLRDVALAAAGRIGKVEVDHGDTSCKTPDAVPYIKKIWDRRKAKKAKKKSAAKKKRARA